MAIEKQIKNIAYFFHSSPENTLAYHRLIGPAQYLRLNVIRGFDVGEINVECVTEGDIVVIQRDFPRFFDDYERIITLARKEKKPVVLDLDDLLLELPEEHPDRQGIYYTDALLPMLQALIEVDMVTVTTVPLKEYVYKYNQNVRIIPNFLNDALWTLRIPTISFDQDRSITIGYMGGNSHAPDLRMIVPIVLELIERFPSKLQFHFWGIAPPAEIASLPQVTHSQLQVYDYPEFAATFQKQSADIFIAPLVENPFNSCKSAIKFLEYSALGVPGVYGDFQPYSSVITNGYDGYLASTTNEWLEYLSELIENPERRIEIASNAQETIRSKWLLSKNVHLWLEAYQEASVRKPSKRSYSPMLTTLRSINSQIGELNTKRDKQIQTQSAQITEHEQLAQLLTARVAEREQQIQTLTAQVTERDQQIQTLTAQVTERDQQIQTFSAQVTERDQQIQALSAQVTERDHQIQALSAQVTERDQQIQALTAQVIEQEQQVRVLTAQVAERDQQVQALSAQLWEITISKAWRLALVFRRIRLFLIPPGGRRDRLVKKLFSVISFPGRIRRYYRLGENLAIIRNSELFDASWYLEQNPDVAQAGIDPVRHYLLHGGFEGRDPSRHFSSVGYLERFQDVQGAGVNPLVHYLLYGNDEGRLPYPIQTAAPSTVEASHSPTRMKNKPSLQRKTNDEAQAIHSCKTGLNLSPIPETTAKMVVEDKNWKDYLLVSTEIKNKEQERSATITLRKPRLIDCDGKDLLKATKSIHLPSSRNVQVSIIIPVYNNAKLLLECLLSLAKDQTFTEYDVCIVDDNSDTETRKIIDNISGIRVVRNAERMGFTLSCNKGAQDARGQFLLFLNNDVQVFEGLLKSLLGTFEENSQVGAVGPKVIYPNGRLQEAGCIINRDGTTNLIGHWDDPSLDRYNYKREVDYISGVCLLIRKDDFLDVVGFDPRFAPAYYEDVDLCCKLREKGMRIIYNPDAVIVHHLSATTSNFFGLDTKVELVTRNRQKLIERWQPLLDETNRVRLIAFYLPQFHPIPENDLWWGKGFTEWRKVTQARPLFDGHYQPHLPADLGFYDLRIPEIMEQQEELARHYGIEGFCYYYYWFNGKRLLETPLERMLKTGRSDFPFCLCWANENWTRRWDGGEKDILIAQHHSEEDDLAVIRDLIRYFKHSNYVRVNGKPILLIYRVNIFPDLRRTAQIWREECRREGIGEIYLVMAETFELSLKNYAPEEFGLDAAVEFPPHGSWGRVSVPKLSSNFSGDIVNYKSEALKYSLKSFPKYIRYKTVMPSWDNSARKQNSATIFINSSPGAYQAWLEFAIRKTREQYSGDHRIVFVSAWNEWAEGNHLEPDQRYGHQYLEATANAIDYDVLNSTQN